ncbi:MAG: GDSL-type esterase/lipase family protein [Clostridium sp.]
MELRDINNDKNNFIAADNKNFQYTGRIDFNNPKAPTMIYAGSNIVTRFQGNSLKIIVKNFHNSYENAIGYIIDGYIHGKVVIKENNKELIIDIPEKLSHGEHDLILFKRADACHYFEFLGVILESGCTLLEPIERSKRRIECYGDSVSAGEVSEALDYIGKVDPEGHEGKYSNSWYSYSMITSRMLNAELHNNAQGGIALLDNTGYFRGDNYIGLESTYDKLRYNPQLGYCNKWDFARYTPHVVIFAIGQNDSHPNNYINTNIEKRETWKSKYKEIIKDLRDKYPSALFILITTLLEHDKGWDDALNEIKEELNDKKVVRYLFKRNGCGTKGHLRIPEAEEMAIELTAFINGFGESIWK